MFLSFFQSFPVFSSRNQAFPVFSVYSSLPPSSPVYSSLIQSSTNTQITTTTRARGLQSENGRMHLPRSFQIWRWRWWWLAWWTSTQFFVSGGVEIPLVIDPWPRRSAGVVRERTFEVLLWKRQTDRQADRQAGEVDLHIVSGRGYIPPFTESNI